MPYWDEWETAKLLVSVHDGSATFGDLFALHNEHRILFPNMFIVIAAKLTQWNVKYLMCSSIAGAAIAAIGLFQLTRFDSRFSLSERLGLLVAMNVLLFTPNQPDSWLFGLQVVNYFVVVCISLSLLVCYLTIPIEAKVALCIGLATIGTFSFANGVAIWIVLSPLLAWKHWRELNKKRYLIAIWIASFALNEILYFFDYRKPAGHPDPVINPIKFVKFIFVLLGAPLGAGFTHATVISCAIGVVLAGVFVAACIYIFLQHRVSASQMNYHEINANLLECTAGWIGLGTFALIAASIITIGRAGFGAEAALPSRYMTFPVLLPVALIPLLAIILRDAAQRNPFLFRPLRSLFAIFVATILGLNMIHISQSVGQFKTKYAERLRAKAALAFINVSPDPESLWSSVYPDVVLLKERANKLNRVGYLTPGLVTSPRIGILDGTVPNADYGSFEPAATNGNEIVISGWAILPHRGEPADAVIISREDSSGAPAAFGFARVCIERTDIATNLGKPELALCGWKYVLPAADGARARISAWAYDALSNQLFRLAAPVSN